MSKHNGNAGQTIFNVVFGTGLIALAAYVFKDNREVITKEVKKGYSTVTKLVGVKTEKKQEENPAMLEKVNEAINKNEQKKEGEA